MEKKVICNCCGQEIQTDQGIEKKDYLHIKKEWGYFSNKDGKIHEFNLCEKCYDHFVSGFQVPVESEDVIEFM